MKQIILIFYCSLTTIFAICTAQNGPTFGSGRILTKEFTFDDFDQISIKDFDGKITITLGQPFSINIAIDDNLSPLLKATVRDHQLYLYLDGNTNGKLYLENTNINIIISLPKLKMVEHRGNTSLDILNIKEASFALDHSGNGNVYITGESNILHISKNGNGNIDARKCKSMTAKVKTYGNGNVLVNTQLSLSAIGNGNGDVIQYGKGKIDAISGIMGNGKVSILSE